MHEVSRNYWSRDEILQRNLSPDQYIDDTSIARGFVQLGKNQAVNRHFFETVQDVEQIRFAGGSVHQKVNSGAVFGNQQQQQLHQRTAAGTVKPGVSINIKSLSLN